MISTSTILLIQIYISTILCVKQEQQLLAVQIAPLSELISEVTCSSPRANRFSWSNPVPSSRYQELHFYIGPNEHPCDNYTSALRGNILLSFLAVLHFTVTCLSLGFYISTSCHICRRASAASMIKPNLAWPNIAPFVLKVVVLQFSLHYFGNEPYQLLGKPPKVNLLMAPATSDRCEHDTVRSHMLILNGGKPKLRQDCIIMREQHVCFVVPVAYDCIKR